MNESLVGFVIAKDVGSYILYKMQKKEEPYLE